MLRFKISVVLCFFYLSTYPQYFEWNKFVIGTNAKYPEPWITDLNVDSSGAVYTCGYARYCQACYKSFLHFYSYPSQSVNMQTAISTNTFGGRLFLKNDQNLIFMEDIGGTKYMSVYDSAKTLISDFNTHLSGDFFDIDSSNNFCYYFKDTLFSFDFNLNPLWFVHIGNYVSDAQFDKNGNLYAMKQDSLFKFDSNGSLLSINKLVKGNKLEIDTDNNIYILNSAGIRDTIVKYDSLKNYIYSIASKTVLDFAVDDNQSIYMTTGDTLNKFDANGNFVWYVDCSHFEVNKIRVDKENNIYFGMTCDSYNNPFFLPPNTYINNTNTQAVKAYIGKINQDTTVTPTITTGYIDSLYTNICAGNKMQITFTVSHYLISYYKDGFKAQLSDSAGSFANPIVIGSGIYSPMNITIPSNLPPGNNYRIRIITSDSTVIGSLNVDGPLTLQQQPPVATITVLNGIFNGGYWDVCAENNITLTSNSDSNYTYNWFWKNGINDYDFIASTQDSFLVTAIDPFKWFYVVRVLDITTGCYRESNVLALNYIHDPNPNFSFLNYSNDSICITHSPLKLIPVSYGDSLYFAGTGVFYDSTASGYFLNPSIAGAGTHSVTCYISNVCGNADSTKFMTVVDTLDATFYGLPDSTCENSLPFNLVPVDSGGMFGGAGISGNLFIPSTAGIGDHTITYSISNLCGLFSSLKIINVSPIPVISFSGLPDTICIYSAPIQFTVFPQGGNVSGTGVSGNTFYPDSAGFGLHAISYFYTDSVGCSNTFSKNVFVDGCLGVDKISDTQTGFFPNPFSEKATLIVSDKLEIQNLALKICNMLGQEIYHLDITSHVTIIDRKNFRSGIYSYQLVKNNEILHLGKIIISD